LRFPLLAWFCEIATTKILTISEIPFHATARDFVTTNSQKETKHDQQVDFEGYLTRAWEYREQRSLGVDGGEGVMGAGLHKQSVRKSFDKNLFRAIL
jgi:hypothetical protein